MDNHHFEVVRHDITFPYSAEVDEIYNLACPASPIHYQYDAIQTIKTSVMGAINMLGLARRLNAKILQASTSEVYGDPEVHPQPESYWGNVNPIGIRSCYDEGKRCSETLFMDYHRQNNVRIKIVRISIHTVLGCCRMTGEWFLIFLSRHWRTTILLSMGQVSKPVASSILMIWLRVWSGWWIRVMIYRTDKSWQSEWIFHASVSGEDHPKDRIEVEDYF